MPHTRLNDDPGNNAGDGSSARPARDSFGVVRRLLLVVWAATTACVVDWDGYEPGGGGAGGEAGGAASADVCGKVARLEDPFNDEVESYWYSQNNAAEEKDGRLKLTDGGGYSSAVSRRAWSLREGYVTIDIPVVADVGNTSFMLTELPNTEGRNVRITRSGDQIYAERTGRNEVVETIGQAATYSAVDHRFWRIGEANGTVYLHTSPDGVAWSELGTIAASELFPMDWVYPVVLLTEADASSITEVESLQGGPAPEGEWCGPSTFRDDFNDGEDSGKWRFDPNAGSVREESETLVLEAKDPTLPDTSPPDAYVESSQPINLEGAGVSFELVERSLVGDQFAEFYVGTDEQNVRFKYGATGFSATIKGGSSPPLTEVTYEQVPHTWFRIREEARTIYWETSADGATWEEFDSAPTPTFLEIKEVYGFSIGVSGNLGRIVIDNVNQP